uniref:Uncharacterized protein n=1 Tax=Arundo donax TaxID=35708 RepID=A0A0A9U892_ARUDO
MGKLERSLRRRRLDFKSNIFLLYSSNDLTRSLFCSPKVPMTSILERRINRCSSSEKMCSPDVPTGRRMLHQKDFPGGTRLGV